MTEDLYSLGQTPFDTLMKHMNYSLELYIIKISFIISFPSIDTRLKIPDTEMKSNNLG